MDKLHTYYTVIVMGCHQVRGKQVEVADYVIADCAIPSLTVARLGPVRYNPARCRTVS